jgi:small subunit ribosomal protein S6
LRRTEAPKAVFSLDRGKISFIRRASLFGRGLNGRAVLRLGFPIFPCSRLRHVSVEPFSGLEGLRAGHSDLLEKGRNMALYEHIYLARQDLTAQQSEALTEQFKATITSLGGVVGKVEYWGVKSLAYRIKKNRKAHFTLINVDAPHAALAEAERQWSISEDILRFLTIRVEALEDGPSAMLRKRDDDDRGDRGDRPDRGDRGDRRPSSRGPRGPRRDDTAEGGQF